MMPEQPTTDPERRGPTPAQHCEAMAAKGDLLGLLDYLETEANPVLLHESLGTISRCIRVRAREDISGLCEDAFARILGMAVLLLSKVQLFITTRLKEAEHMGAHTLSQLPRDVTEDGWLERCERLSRFIAEMAADRARVRHLDGMNDDANKSRRPQRRSRSAAALAGDRSQAPHRKGPSRKGRVCRQAAALGRGNGVGRPLPRPQPRPALPEINLLGGGCVRPAGVEADPALACRSHLA